MHEQAWPRYEEALIQGGGDNAHSPGKRQAARPHRSPGGHLRGGGQGAGALQREGATPPRRQGAPQERLRAWPARQPRRGIARGSTPRPRRRQDEERKQNSVTCVVREDGLRAGRELERGSDLNPKITRRRFLQATAGGAAWPRSAAPWAAIRHPRARATAASAPAGQAWSFRSRPDLHPPVIEVTTQARDTAPAYIFIAPKNGPG